MLRKPSINDLTDRLLDQTFNSKPVDQSKHILRKFICVLFLAALFMGAEITGGIFSNSLAILSDAAHMLSDLLGFIISMLSVYISGLPFNKKHSYGYHRAGVIGALASVLVIWTLTGFFIYYAVERIINLEKLEVEGKLMFGIACFGLVTNLIMMRVLHTGGEHRDHDDHSQEDMSEHQIIHQIIEEKSEGCSSQGSEYYAFPLKGDSKDIMVSEARKLENETLGTIDYSENASVEAWMLKRSEAHNDSTKSTSKAGNNENISIHDSITHILGNSLQNLGAIIASALIWINPNLKIADPIATLIFAAIVFYTTIRITKDCIFVLMEGTPIEFDLDDLKSKIMEVKDVVEVHDLHIWALNIGRPSMSAHLITDGNPDTVLKHVTRICNGYGISHSTIQVETVQDELHEDYFECKPNIH